MSFDNLPESIKDAIQEGMLEREFKDGLKAKLGFRDIADKEAFPANIGETLTKTRAGLLPANTTPLDNKDNSLLDSGIAHKSFPIEQYTLSVDQYGDGMKLNLVRSSQAIASVFLQNAKTLSDQASRSIDTLARNALFKEYLAGNTFVSATLGAAGAAVSVDDIRGFSAGQSVSVNGSLYTVASTAAAGTNASIVPGGVSGTITFTSNVSIANGTLGNLATKSDAAFTIRATDELLLDNVLDASAQLAANGVPTLSNGYYRCYVDPKASRGVLKDPQFKNWAEGNMGSSEFRSGVIGVAGGVEFVQTNMNPRYTKNGVVRHQSIVVGAGALVEGQFTNAAYSEASALAGSSMQWVDGVVHITAAPIDALQQIVRQSWAYIGGFTAPTDKTTTPDVMPSASNASLKRGVVIESK